MALEPDTNEFCTLVQQHFNPDEFKRLVAFVSKDITEYTSTEKPHPSVILEVVTASQRQGWYDHLIQAAAFQRDQIAALTEFAQKRRASSSVQLEPKVVPAEQVTKVHELVVNRENVWIDPAIMRYKLAEVEPCVCSISIETDQGSKAYGTGFLVAADVLMTNYHVVEPIAKGEKGQTTAQAISAKRANVRCRFDYKAIGPGTVQHGSECGLPEKWLLDESDDDMVNVLPRSDALDYALVRLDRKVGNEKIELYPGATPVERGWLTPEPNYTLRPGASLLILQHPQGAPLKMGLDAAAVTEINANGTRITYTTNTEGGASGSPCFNLNLQLVALHHSAIESDPTKKVNEGIPFKAIMPLLEQRDAASYLAPPIVRATPVKAGASDYFSTFVMRGGRVFLGRDNFRAQLRQLGVDQRSRVLAVIGDPKTGKTYSEDFIQHLHASALPARQQKLIALDVDRDAATPEDLIGFLTQDLGVDTLPPNKRPDASRWLRNDVIPAIKRAVENNDKIDEWWVLLDGFRSNEYPEKLTTFISELSRAVNMDTLLPRLRLVLVNYRRLSPDMLTDKAEGISVQDILDFFHHANDEEGKRHSDEELKREAQQIVDEVAEECEAPERKQDYLQTLSGKITESARRLFPEWMKA